MYSNVHVAVSELHRQVLRVEATRAGLIQAAVASRFQPRLRSVSRVLANARYVLASLATVVS